MAPPTPTLKGSDTTVAPASSASLAVSSVEPSLTTRMSASGLCSRTLAMTSAIDPCSFHAGIATRARPDIMGPTLSDLIGILSP